MVHLCRFDGKKESNKIWDIPVMKTVGDVPWHRSLP